MPNKCPPRLLTFQFLSNPPDLIRTPRLLILRKLTSSTNPSFHFLSLLVLFKLNFHGKIAYCYMFSFMLYDNLFLFFSSLHNHLKLFLKFRPPRLLTFGVFSDPPPCLLGPPFIGRLRILVSFKPASYLKNVYIVGA